MNADNHTLREKEEKQGLLMHLNYNIKNLPNQKQKNTHKGRKKCEQGIGGVKTQRKEKIAQCKRS